MKVVHLSTVDVSGGAARAAYRVHAGLRRSGCDSSMFVLRKKSNDANIRVYKPSAGPIGWSMRRWRKMRIERSTSRYRATRPKGLESFSDDRTPFGEPLFSQFPEGDILNLHWIRGFVEVSSFFRREERPVVWTLHDMNAFTGGCHYTGGCNCFSASCGACPQLGSDEDEDLSREVWARKNAAYACIDPGRLHIVAPSSWLAEEAARSSLLQRFSRSVIPYGLDTAVFTPRKRGEVRAELGIPTDQRVLLFVSDSIKNERKGFSLLLQALTELADKQGIFLVSVGRKAPEVGETIGHRHFGQVSDDVFLAKLYAGADLFIIPSVQDNLPNTVLESMACGTPVIGFDVGGIPDMVRPGITGALAPAGDVAALRNGILRLLDAPVERRRMAEQCRRVAVMEYGLRVQAERYLALYESMLSEAKPMKL